MRYGAEPLQSPRLEKYEQVVMPKVVRTVEVRKDVPVTVDVPIPFMVPRAEQLSVDVPLLKFDDQFVPVPVSRTVLPKITFTDEIYEVECSIEKPVLIVEDTIKPVPVDIPIKLREKDIRVHPVDPAEMPQADLQALWMRVNADLLDKYRHKLGKDPEGLVKGAEPPFDLHLPDVEGEEKVDYGPIPMHHGHPLMMTYLSSSQCTAQHSTQLPNSFGDIDVHRHDVGNPVHLPEA